MFERFKKKKKKKKEQMPIGEALDKIISGEQTGQAEPRKISQDLDRVISEIQPERKPSIKPQTEQEEQKPRAKPVDAIERERSWGKSVRDIFTSQLLGMGELLGTGLKTKSESAIRSSEEGLKELEDKKDLNKFQRGALSHQYKSAIFLNKKARKAEESIENFFGGRRKLIEEYGEIDPTYLNFRKENGKIDPMAFLTPKKGFHLMAQGMGSMIPAIGVAMATREPKVMGLSMAFIEKGDAVQTYAEKMAKEKGIEVGKLSEKNWDEIDEQSDYAAVMAGMLESIVPMKIASQLGGKQAMSGFLKSGVLKTPIKVLRSVFTAVFEAGTEGLQRFSQNLVAKESGINPKQDLMEGVYEEAGAGLFGAMPLTVAGEFGGRQAPIQPAQPQEILKEQPAEKELAKEKPASENVNKTFGLLAEDDKEALTELLPKMSQEEILEVRDALVKMERQGKKDALEDRKMIEDILIDRETKSNETAKKILEEGKLESLEELPLEDRKKVIGAVEKTKDETAIGEITKEREKQTKLKEEKTKLLAERKEKPEQKKEIQAKIDKIDEQRRDEFVAEPVSKEQADINIETNAKQLGISVEEYKSKFAPEAREGVAKTIKEEKGIKTREGKITTKIVKSIDNNNVPVKNIQVNATPIKATINEALAFAKKAGLKNVEVDNFLMLNRTGEIYRNEIGIGDIKKVIKTYTDFYNQAIKKYEHKQKTTTKPKGISEARKAGKPEPKKVSDKTAEAREKQPVGRRVEEYGEKLKAKKKTDKKEKYQKMTARELALDVQYSGQYEYVNKKWQLKPVIEEQISSKEAIKIFRQFFTKEEMPIEVVERITTEDGGGAWASVTPELVKFIQNPKESTPYHEAVHAYLNKYATKKQWGELMSEVKKEKYGEKTEAEITNAELEEDLAEDFIGYVKNRKAPSSNIIKRFYDDVIKFLKKLIGKENKIEAFYEAIIEKKRPGYLQKTKLLLGKLRERELLYQRKRSKEYVEALKAMSKRDTKSFEDITEITDKAAFNSYFRKDINWIEELFAQSRDIYLKDKKEFVAAKMFEDSANDRRMNKSDMDNSVSKLLKPYYDLNKKSQDKLNRVLMHGDMEGKKYNKTELAELGIITKEEITAYYNIRKSFEKVLDTIVEKMREVGVSEDEIADFQRTKIGYMPHKWEHKFVVKEQKQDADGNWQTISMEDFAKKKWSMKAWIERKRQNKREDIRYVPGTLDSIDVDFFTEQRLSFENFKSIIENAKAPEDMKKTVLEAIKNMVKEKGFGRHFIRRTGVEGYDMNRTPVIIADYFSGFSGYITKMEASPKYFEALEKIDPVKQKKFYRWMRNTIAYDMGNAPEYNEIKTLAFTYYLANDISFLATNATQNFTVGIGELSKLSKGGKKVYQPEQKLLAANKDWWTQNISEEEKASVKKLLDEGRLGAEMTGELMGFKNNPLYRSVSRNLNSALFSTTAFVERNVNRVPAFLAARRILESQGITGEELNKQALDKSDDIHFRYGKQHRPMLYRKYGGPVFVFTHYIRSFMFQLSRDVKHREFVSLGRKMFYTSFFGGLTALPFAKLIVETWKEIVGDWDDDDESKEEVSRWETMVKKGVPASFGVDMSGRVSIDIFALENIKDDPKNITKWVGAAGGLIVRGHQGYEMVRQGRYIEASGKLLPDFAGNPFRGYYGYEYGVRSFGGVPLETKDEELFEYSFSEALTKGVGFSPTRETALYEKIREERKKKDKKSKKRKRLKMKIEDAKRRGDYKKRRELKRELRKLE